MDLLAVVKALKRRLLRFRQIQTARRKEWSSGFTMKTEWMEECDGYGSLELSPAARI
jgi:hypothetical protein